MHSQHSGWDWRPRLCTVIFVSFLSCSLPTGCRTCMPRGAVWHLPFQVWILLSLKHEVKCYVSLPVTGDTRAPPGYGVVGPHLTLLLPWCLRAVCPAPRLLPCSWPASVPASLNLPPLSPLYFMFSAAWFPSLLPLLPVLLSGGKWT